jgi:hypothetical protein
MEGVSAGQPKHPIRGCLDADGAALKVREVGCSMFRSKSQEIMLNGFFFILRKMDRIGRAPC